MDIVFELIFELFFEGSLEITKNKKISKWIRYPLMGIICLFFLLFLGLIFFLGISLYKENKIGSFLIISIGVFMMIGSVVKLKNVWHNKYENKTD